MPVDKMMDGIEPDQSDENQIDRNDVVQQSRDDQDEDAGDDGDQRRDMSSGDDHGFSSGWGVCDGTKRIAERSRTGPAAEERARAGLVLADSGKLGTAVSVIPGRRNAKSSSGGTTESPFDPREIGDEAGCRANSIK